VHGRFDMDREMSDERFNLGLVSTLVDSSSNGNPNPAGYTLRYRWYCAGINLNLVIVVPKNL
jgi:hypothetical protein